MKNVIDHNVPFNGLVDKPRGNLVQFDAYINIQIVADGC